VNDLRLDRLLVVYPGNKPYTLATNVEVVPAASVVTLVE
jgi:hypothetical protein